MTRHGKVLLVALTLGAVPLISGCGAAAVGAAGAGGAAAGLAYSERGAESHVNAGITTVANATEAVFRAMNITLEERDHEPDEMEIEIKGDDGASKVVVDIEGNRDAGQTHIEVTVSRNMVDYDKSRAEQILRAILARL